MRHEPCMSYALLRCALFRCALFPPTLLQISALALPLHHSLFRAYVRDRRRPRLLRAEGATYTSLGRKA